MQTILFIEDNKAIKQCLDYLFMQHDFLLLWAPDLKTAEKYIFQKNFDLIILDVTLPDGDGFSFYKNMKEYIHVPLLFLTAKDLEDDIVHGLELGASDYIVKPFKNRELILRIHNALKFFKSEKRILYVKDIEINLENMQIMRNKKEITLTALEYKLFLFLVENSNRIISRETILNKIYEESGNYVNDNTLTVYIKRIREKLGKDDIIKTIKGMGYMVERS